MGTITVVNNITLDGVMQAPARLDEDTRDGFSQGGWAMPFQDAVIGSKMGGKMASADGALLLGRRTYEDFYSVWPQRKDNPFTEHLNNVKKYVVSTTLEEPLPWQNSVLINDRIIDTIASLKETNNNLTILGSGALVQSLMAHNLIDSYWLLIFPIVLGTGRKLFNDGCFAKLRLIESTVSTTGVIITQYENQQ